jgi:hypothetical protein
MLAPGAAAAGGAGARVTVLNRGPVAGVSSGGLGGGGGGGDGGGFGACRAGGVRARATTRRTPIRGGADALGAGCYSGGVSWRWRSAARGAGGRGCLPEICSVGNSAMGGHVPTSPRLTAAGAGEAAARARGRKRRRRRLAPAAAADPDGAPLPPPPNSGNPKSDSDDGTSILLVASAVGLLTGMGLHSLTSELNLRNIRNTSLTSELHLSNFGTHPRVNLGHMGDKVSLS